MFFNNIWNNPNNPNNHLTVWQCVCVDIERMLALTNTVTFTDLSSAEVKRRVGFELGRSANIESKLDIEFLAGVLLSKDAEKTLRNLNPFLEGDSFDQFCALSAAMMFRTVCV